MPEKPPRMMALDGLASFVPSIEAGSRALRKEADRCKRALLFTDCDYAAKDAKELEALARHLDVRRVRVGMVLLSALAWLPMAACDAKAIVEVCVTLDSIVVDSAGAKVVFWKTPCR